MSTLWPREGREPRLTVLTWLHATGDSFLKENGNFVIKRRRYVGQAKIMDVFYLVIHFLHVAKYKKKKIEFSYFLDSIRWCQYSLALASVKSLFPFSHFLLLLIFMAFFFLSFFLLSTLLAF